MKNQRNLYRILHVQPEAPLEVIKASYRSMMTKLGYHPDRGGDHEAAVLINHAYAVLSDPVKREEYDRLLPQRHRKRTEEEGSATASEFNRSHFPNTEAQRSNDDRCTFCGERVVAVVHRPAYDALVV